MRGGAVSGLLALAATCLAGGSLPTKPEELAALAKAAAPSLVRVEYTLQYDNGEAPQASGWRSGGSLQDHIRDERPLEMAGLLVSPTQVVTSDILLHPRFVTRVAVRFGEQAVEARPAACPLGQDALLLELAQPLQGAKPLAFDARRGPPYLAITHAWSASGGWTTRVQPLSGVVAVAEDGRPWRDAPAEALIVDRAGTPVGIATRDELPLDDSWKGSPLKWPAVSAAERAKLLDELEKRTNAGVLRVVLRLRSPKKKAGSDYAWRDRDEEREGTERNVAGVLLDAKRVLVLEGLKPAQTARLEQILVAPPQGEPVRAKFVCSVRDYGALLAELERPLEGALALSSEPILAFRGRLLLVADIKMAGERRLAYFDHTRIASLDLGRKRKLYPEVFGDSPFVFDLKGQLVALPVEPRSLGAIEDRWERDRSIPTPVAHLRELLSEPAKHADPSNVPLSEDQEARLAWMGVELQPLTRELARANKVSHLTRDGETGVLVAHVYPDSPAAQAGIQPGFVLLRLNVEGEPKPVEVKLHDDGYPRGPSPWERLGEVPETYYERIPPPWPPAENALSRILTDIGFGRKYVAEFSRDGTVVRKGFTIVQGPPHFDAAPRLKSADLGLTLRDITYEVCRYFQRKPDEPGAIISKVEMGSRASVAGLRPYEIITHVDDKPIANVTDFEKGIKDRKELRLAVKRMTRSRIVEIKMDAPLPKPRPPTPQPRPGEEPEETEP